MEVEVESPVKQQQAELFVHEDVVHASPVQSEENHP